MKFSEEQLEELERIDILRDNVVKMMLELKLITK